MDLVLAQRVFDKVVRHVVVQGRPAMTEYPLGVAGPDGKWPLRCAYRAPDGASCAVGCLIKDEHFSQRFNFDGIEDPGVEQALQKSLEISGEQLEDIRPLLEGVQRVHDGTPVPKNSTYAKEVAIGYARMAERYGLTMPTLETT